MRGWQVSQHVHPSKLTINNELKEPTPGENEVLVDIHSAALNFFDILQAQGKHQSQPKLPFVLGAEFAGRISSRSPIPRGCPFKPGDRVFGSGQGAFAERIAVNWKGVLPLPKNLTFEQAAGLYVTFPTSYRALVDRAEMKAGDWVLVHAAAGGVGLSAVQIAKALGAKVIGTAGSAEKLKVVKEFGQADEVLDYTKEGWQKDVLRITGGKGVDIVYDPVGLIRDSLKCIAWNGRALVVGFAGGNIEKLALNLVLLKNISIVGIFWGAHAKNEPEAIQSVWKRLMELFESGKLDPVVYSKVYGIEELPAGLGDLEARKTFGKVAIHMSGDGPRSKL